MRDAYEAILSYDELTPEEQASLRRQLETSPELGEILVRWQTLQAEARNNLHRVMPDRTMLVLYALDAEGVTLSDEEATWLEETRDALDAAFAAHPALRDVSDQIRAASREFSRLWDEAPAETPGARRDRSPNRRAQNRSTWRKRVVAGVFLLVTAVSVSVLAWRSEHLVVVHTDYGQTEDVIFADGSTIRLLGPSRLSYRKSERSASATRAVTLRGQAFFHVIPGDEAFMVETPTARTSAIGTSFSIQASLAQTQVILASGQVSVASRRWNHPPVTLSPGQTSRIRGLRRPTPPAAVSDMARTLSWSGYLVFHETPLREVARHLSQTYGETVTIEPALENERFTATLAPDSLSIDQAVNLIAIAFNTRAVRNDQAIHLGAPENILP
ncbi:MAG: FecR domain-containing protein [Rhodothermales bacterium]|nr:FecR domain-containing protein [Rhodothermales bacterium]